MDSGSLLDKLPAELRNEIYRYLLSTTHTRIVVNPWTYGPCDSFITQQLQPRFRYDMQTNILCTSRRILYEAIAIFRQNQFVRINTRALLFRRFFTSWGFVPVSSGRRAKYVEEIVMSITYEDKLNNNGEELFVILALEDLRHLCRYFHPLYTIDSLQNLAFKVVIHGSSEIRGLVSRSKRLLEPLAELYGIARLRISGPVDVKYKSKIIHQIARPAPRHEESLEVIGKLWKKGDDALRCHQAAVAQEQYTAALLHLENRTWDMNRIETGPFANSSRYKVYHFVVIPLLRSLAITFLIMRKPDKAHFWASLALESIERHVGTFSHPPDQHTELARLMARSSMALGRKKRALIELGWALHFKPNNALVKGDLVQLCAEKGGFAGAGGGRGRARCLLLPVNIIQNFK